MENSREDHASASQRRGCFLSISHVYFLFNVNVKYLYILEMGNPPSGFVSCEGALNLEPECRGHGPLPVVERDERDCAGLTGQVEGGRDMPQIGTSLVEGNCNE